VDRAAGFEPVGREFESLRARQKTKDVEQANASQHLAVIRAKQIVVSRKVGNQVYYSIRDPALKQVARNAPKSRANAHR
jgi:DNA-binding transcriptional ArsR family regulator